MLAQSRGRRSITHHEITAIATATGMAIPEVEPPVPGVAVHERDCLLDREAVE